MADSNRTTQGVTPLANRRQTAAATARWLRRTPLWFLLLIVTAALYARTVRFEFVLWDDGQLIGENEYVNAANAGAALAAWKAPHMSMYIPLVYNLWWLLAQVGRGTAGALTLYGLSAWPFHLANVTVHWANGCLVLAILLRLGARRWAAFFGAVIFLIHPLQVEAVCWASAMKDLFSGALALASIYAYLRAAEHWRDGKGTRAHLAYSTALLLVTLGSLAKPGMLGAPLIAGVLDALFISRLSRMLVLRVLLLTAVLLPSAFWTTLAQPVAYPAGIDLAMRPAIAAHALGFYIQKLFIPTRLCVDHGLRPLVVVTQWRHLAIGFIVPAMLFLLLLARRHRRMLAAGGIVFVLGVAPVLGLVPFGFQFWSTVAERYVYLSMLGVAIAAAHLITLVPARSVVAAACAIIVGLAVLNTRQAEVWHDTIELMNQCLRINPSSAVAYNNFAGAFGPTPEFEIRLQVEGNPASRPTGALNPKVSAELVALADQYFTKAFLLCPEYPDPLRNMIRNRAGRGRYKEAIDLCELAIRQSRYDVFRWLIDPYQLGWLYQQVGRNAEAATLFQKALRSNPNHAGARAGLRQLAAASTTQAANTADAPRAIPTSASAPAPQPHGD